MSNYITPYSPYGAPDEVIAQVCDLLPEKDLFQMFFVCKQWGRVADDETQWRRIGREKRYKKKEGQTWRECAKDQAKCIAVFREGEVLKHLPVVSSSLIKPQPHPHYSSSFLVPFARAFPRGVVGGFRERDKKIQLVITDLKTEEVVHAFDTGELADYHKIAFCETHVTVLSRLEDIHIFYTNGKKEEIAFPGTNRSCVHDIAISSDYFAYIDGQRDIFLKNIHTGEQLGHWVHEKIRASEFFDTYLVVEADEKIFIYDAVSKTLFDSFSFTNFSFTQSDAVFLGWELKGNIFISNYFVYGTHKTTIGVYYLCNHTRDFSFSVPGKIVCFALQGNVLAYRVQMEEGIIHLVDINNQKTVTRYDPFPRDACEMQIFNYQMVWDGYMLFMIGRSHAQYDILVEKWDFSQETSQIRNESVIPLEIDKQIEIDPIEQDID
jgi:hypothetical protein